MSKSIPLDLYQFLQTISEDRCLSQTELLEQIDYLVHHPQNCVKWHVFLKDNAAKEKSCPEEAKELLEWLKLGMKKGWLQYIDTDHARPMLNLPIFSSYKDQDSFWRCYEDACLKKLGRLSIVLFDLGSAENKDCIFQELLEQLLHSIRKQDFFGEMPENKVALVLPGTGSFRATALVERILGTLAKNLPQFYVKAGLAEMEDGEGANTLYANAQKALLQEKDAILRVQVYHPEKKECESLVHADEKRFLFFGQ